MDNFNVYRDIEARTGGEIYIGVVGPVRTDVYKRQELHMTEARELLWL